MTPTGASAESGSGFYEGPTNLGIDPNAHVDFTRDREIESNID